MLFNSVIFLFFYLPIAYFVFWKLKTKEARYLWLTVGGYVFYGWWSFKFCFLMLFSTLVSYFAGLYLLKTEDPKKKKIAMIVAISIDLLLLGFFKYFNFLAENLNSLSSLLGVQATIPAIHVILPVGISFYTFHTMSYMIDAYRGVIRPTRNFFEFTTYVSLFSQLVAGPIVRFRQIEDDLEKIDRPQTKNNLELGFQYLVLGLFKKVMIADSLAAWVDPGFAASSDLNSLSTWLIVLGYTYQLYFDFSGYSDMAVGLGFLFGIQIPINFDSPYKALNPSDFWKRWHISLSSWLRDYLYISLGGNRSGEWKTYRNLFLTMLLGGLWHGAQWTFVIWGAYHGLLLIAHRVKDRVLGEKFSFPAIFSRLLMFVSAVVGWVFFRAMTVEESKNILKKMFSLTSGSSLNHELSFMVMITLAATTAHFLPNTHEWRKSFNKPYSLILILMFILVLTRIISNENSPFLYFQF